MHPIVMRAIRLSFQRTASELPLDIVWDPELSPFESILKQMLAEVSETTQKRIREIVGNGIRDGIGTSQIQQQIQDDRNFAPYRALRIARTETTKALNAGTDSALNDAAGLGLEVRKMWVSARDSSVRPSHQVGHGLDGQLVGSSESFVCGFGPNIGRLARYPGDFGIAGEDINCRCGLISVID